MLIANNSRKKVRFITNNEVIDEEETAVLSDVTLHRGQGLLQLLRTRFQLTDLPVLVYIGPTETNDKLAKNNNYDQWANYVTKFQPAGSTFSIGCVYKFIDGLVSEDDDTPEWSKTAIGTAITQGLEFLTHLWPALKSEKQEPNVAKMSDPTKKETMQTPPRTMAPLIVRVGNVDGSRDKLVTYSNSRGVGVQILASVLEAMAWIDRNLG